MEFRISSDSALVLIGDETNPSTESIYPMSWWATQEPAYALPVSRTWEWYIQGQFHKTFDFESEYPATYPWPEGDIYISKKAVYDAAYASYLTTPTTLSQAKAIKMQELQAKMSETRNGMVSITAVNYPSNYVAYDRLFSECGLFTGIGAVPVGYYVLDENNNQVATNLAELQALVAKIQDLLPPADLA